MAEQDTSKESGRGRRDSEVDGEANAEENLSADELTGEGAEAGEGETAEEPRLNRRQRRAAAARGGDASADEIRDRNRRLREARRAKRAEERDVAAAAGLDTAEMVDDALTRGTHALGRFVKRHANLLQAALVLGIVGGIGWQIYSWRHGKEVAQATDELMDGVAAENGIVGEAPTGPEAAFEVRPVFATEEARLKAASDAYQEAISTRPGTSTATLAKLGLAGLRYDQGQYDEAVAAYREVRESELAKKDNDVRLRAAEGIGLALEAKGDREGALKAFKELVNSDVFGFTALGMFHQARLHFQKGEKDQAKELLNKVKEKIGKPEKPQDRLPYLETATQALLEDIDPSLAASPSAFTPEQIQALQQQSATNPAGLGDLLKQMGLDAKITPPGEPAPLPDNAGGEPAPASEQPASEPGAPAGDTQGSAAPATNAQPAAPKPAPAAPAAPTTAPKPPTTAAPKPPAASPAPGTAAPASPAPPKPPAASPTPAAPKPPAASPTPAAPAPAAPAPAAPAPAAPSPQQ